MWETGLIGHINYSKRNTNSMNILVFYDIKKIQISGVADVDATVSLL